MRETMEWKNLLMENDIPRDKGSVGLQIINLVSLKAKWISNESTQSGTRSKLWSRRIKSGDITENSKHFEMSITGRLIKEKLMRRLIIKRN